MDQGMTKAPTGWLGPCQCSPKLSCTISPATPANHPFLMELLDPWDDDGLVVPLPYITGDVKHP